MINLAVVNLKDIVRCLIKLIIAILVLWLFSLFFKNSNLKQWSKSKEIDTSRLTAIIDESIPGIRLLKKNEDTIETTFSKINPLKIMLQSQLKMIDGTKKKIEDNESLIEANKINIEHAKTDLQTEVVENNIPNNFTNSYESVEIKNDTDYNLTEEMLTPNIDINKKDIIIFHTHTCESYTPTEEFNYEQTGTYRTTDLGYSVARVGTELTNQLISYNYNVIHDTTYHDYPAYTGSYGRSMNTVRTILANNDNTDVILDIHRDAIADYSYAPTVKIGEEYASQLMFVIGTDGGGLEHPNWQQNLKFAVKVQEKANELYPGLFRPILLRNSRYNQQLGRAACIIEVGATGNTLEQSMTSMKYLAKVLSEVLK